MKEAREKHECHPQIVRSLAMEGHLADRPHSIPFVAIGLSVLAIFNTRGIFKKQEAANLKNRRIRYGALTLQDKFKQWSEQYILFSARWANTHGFVQILSLLSNPLKENCNPC